MGAAAMELALEQARREHPVWAILSPPIAPSLRLKHLFERFNMDDLQCLDPAPVSYASA